MPCPFLMPAYQTTDLVGVPPAHVSQSAAAAGRELRDERPVSLVVGKPARRGLVRG